MHFLGIDIGSSYTKITVIGQGGRIEKQLVLKTLNRDKNKLAQELEVIKQNYEIEAICSTGYGREHFKEANVTKTEILCASVGVTQLYAERKNIIDIGGEDIKVIRSGADGKVEDFYMNTKCAAGTGTFITEIAERAELDLSKMSELAARSGFDKELNSFCTVFAKTEIMQWIFDEVPVEDLARGIYLSILNRIAKIKVDRSLPIYLIGGVISHHPYLGELLAQKSGQKVIVPKDPQLINSLGAAWMARKLKEPETKEIHERLS